MRFLLVLFLFGMVLSSGLASRYAEQDITVELGSPSFVNVTLVVDRLTSEKLTYLTPYLSVLFHSTENGAKLPCQTRIIDVGTQFVCSPQETTNFTVSLSYTTNQLITEFSGSRFGSFSYPVLEPIGRQFVRLILPEGMGLLQSNISDYPVVSPPGFSTGSTLNGRQIVLSWMTDQISTGEILQYSVFFEELRIPVGGGFSPITLVISLSVFFVFVVLWYFYSRRRRKREARERVDEVLTAEEREILDFLRDREGKTKQRDLVRAFPHSKAKISRLVDDLCKRNLLLKERRGRTNYLTVKGL